MLGWTLSVLDQVQQDSLETANRNFLPFLLVRGILMMLETASLKLDAVSMEGEDSQR